MSISFFEVLKNEKPLSVAGAINPYSALLAKKTGIKALYISGAGVATPAPDIYKAFMPVFLASKAEYGLIAPATESGFSFFKTSKKEILTRCAPLKFSSIHCEKML